MQAYRPTKPHVAYITQAYFCKMYFCASTFKTPYYFFSIPNCLFMTYMHTYSAYIYMHTYVGLHTYQRSYIFRSQIGYIHTYINTSHKPISVPQHFKHPHTLFFDNGFPIYNTYSHTYEGLQPLGYYNRLLILFWPISWQLNSWLIAYIVPK